MASAIMFGCSLSVEDYWDVPEFARRAEAMGFQRVSMGEHVMDGNPPRPTLLNVPAMAAAAGATSSLRVMTGIVIAPLYHPVLLSKLVTSLDQVSNGRLDFGIGISGQRGTKVEFDALGIPTRTRGRRTNEMLEIMRRLWTEEHVDHHGDFFDFQDVTLLPQPVQKPYPPVWVSGRSEAAMRRAALLGEGWYPYLFSVRRLKASNDMVRQFAAEANRDLDGFHWGLNQPTAISQDRDEAFTPKAWRGPSAFPTSGRAIRHSRAERGRHCAGPLHFRDARRLRQGSRAENRGWSGAPKPGLPGL